MYVNFHCQDLFGLSYLFEAIKWREILISGICDMWKQKFAAHMSLNHEIRNIELGGRVFFFFVCFFLNSALKTDSHGLQINSEFMNSAKYFGDLSLVT